VEALLAREHRVIVGITGPPGVGKSTLSSSIIATVSVPAVVVPMDGFHLADVELARLGRLDRKGAIDTFDGHGYLALLQRLRAGGDATVYAPAFDRDIEQPIAGSIPIPNDARLIITEGNYLLDDEAPWPAARALLSQAWYLDAPDEVRRERLVERHIRFGKTPQQARDWVRDVDDANARRIETTRSKADLVVTL
jgi:pantothenate kinase